MLTASKRTRVLRLVKSVLAVARKAIGAISDLQVYSCQDTRSASGPPCHSQTIFHQPEDPKSELASKQLPTSNSRFLVGACIPWLSCVHKHESETELLSACMA